jgi:hypothetical protein
VLFTIIVIVIVALIAALLFTRRGGNKGERDITSGGVNDVGRSGPDRPNTPRGGNAAGR